MVSPDMPTFRGTPLVPAHFLKESSVAVTVGFLGPQDVCGLEGLAVLLLGSLDIILWRAEKAVSKQVLGGNQGWLPVACDTVPTLCWLFSTIWTGLPQVPKKPPQAEGNQTQPGQAMGNVTSLCRWQALGNVISLCRWQAGE